MTTIPDTFQELALLLENLQRDYPHWQEHEIVSQLRRSVPEYAHGIWSVALPFNRGNSDLAHSYQERFEQLRHRAVADEQLDLAHVITSIDVKQSVNIIRDAYASWAGDLGTHVLANFVRQTRVDVGSADSLAGLADLHGDMDGDNIAKHMPEDQAVAAIKAYYHGDEALMQGVTVHSRYSTFSRDLGLLDDGGKFSADRKQVRFALRNRTREFIELDELDLDARHPLKLLKDLFDVHEQAQIDALLNTALDQFLAILASGVARERAQR